MNWIESTFLPLVVAFGLGVIVMSIATDEAAHKAHKDIAEARRALLACRDADVVAQWGAQP